MDLGIKGKVALVAASSKGIGKAIAFALADESVNLSIFSRSKDEIERTASEIRTRFPVDVLASAADVTNKEQVDRVIEDTVKTLGGIDILINNAGGPPFGFFEDFESPRMAERLGTQPSKRHLSGEESSSSDEGEELGKDSEHNLNSR